MSEPIKLAVVGGGPKAAALAAKAACLREKGVGDVRITVFEPNEIGAYWTGKHGYTDGKQLLCTPAERDLGFPYESMFGKPLDRQLYAEYSWASYNVHVPRAYSKWVDHGGGSPAHEEFAKYLAWSLKKSEAEIIAKKVCKLHAVSGKWRIKTRNQSDKLVFASSTLFDGVVITGPGPARRVPISAVRKNVFDGSSFWDSLPTVKSILDENRDDQVVVIGGGGTGAAVLAWLTRNGYHDRALVLIADQATLFSRGDSVFENRLFSNESAWEELSPGNREHFFARLNRGVVWNTVMEDLAVAANLLFMDGRAKLIDSDSHGNLRLTVGKWNGSCVTLNPSIVVDASGFNAWWFIDLLAATQRAPLSVRAMRDKLQETMGGSLEFSSPIWTLPPLHAPMLSSNVGPGFGSLMSLGGMSDRILGRYINPATASSK